MIIKIDMPHSFVAMGQADSVNGLNMLRRQLTATVERFNPQGKKTIDKICLLDDVQTMPGVFQFRTGLLPRLRETAPLCGLRIEAEEDTRQFPAPSLSIKPVLGVRPYQEDLVTKVLAHPMGILCAATGAGKTFMAAAMIARRQVPTLYLVHTLDLLEQTKVALEGLLKCKVGTIAGGKVNFQPVTVGMVQSLANIDGMDPKTFGMIIVDETHHLPADTFYAVTEKFTAPYVHGLSATPYRQDKADMMIEAGAGPITARISVSWLIDNGFLAKPMIFFHATHEPTSYDKLPTFLVYRRYMVENQQRNAMIAGLAMNAVAEGKTTLIYVRQTGHADQITKHLSGTSHVLLDGKDSAERRRDVFGKLKSGAIKLVCSTLVREGVDIPKLDVMINAAGGADTMQIVGRALRKADGKTHAVYHDFVDNGHVSLQRTSHARIERLRQEPAFKIMAEV
jgi:superfamily II DNA or RNA helicase